jgi:hypothetical protein
VASLESPPPECLMAQFRMLVSATSIQIVCGSQFVMSVPLRIWEKSSRDSNGKILWCSRSRTDLEERTLIDALDRAIRDDSGLAVNRRLLRALDEQSPTCSAAAPRERDHILTAGPRGLAAAVRVEVGAAGVRLVPLRRRTAASETHSDAVAA